MAPSRNTLWRAFLRAIRQMGLPIGTVFAGLLLLETAALAVAPADALKKDGQFQFDDTPLKDVVSFVSQIYNVKIEFDKGVDQKASIKVNFNGTLDKFFDNTLKPIGMEHEVVKDKILIRKTKKKSGE